MSGWTVITIRAEFAENYEHSRSEYKDAGPALEDLAATMDEDARVRAWTTDHPHIYAYLNCGRYDWDFAEGFLDDYEAMVRDAVVLGANDTTDTGTARYYPSPTTMTDEYKERQGEDGTHVGNIALQVVGGRHGIIPRDPFHDWLGRFDDKYAEDGQVQIDEVQE